MPNLSETLWWWGLADRVVGVTDWCAAPPHGFPGATRVRGTKNPDTEAIVDLGPDLVIANDEENREIDVRRLRDAGVRVHVTRARSVEDAAMALAELGEVVGVPAAGDGLAQDLRRALVRSGEPARMLRTFCPIWRDPWMALGTETFAGDLLARAGFAVVPDEPRYPRVSLDEVARAGVEVVLLPDEPYVFTDDHRADFTGWDVRIRMIDGTALTWWGPRTPSALASLRGLASHLRRRGTRPPNVSA